MNKEGCVRKLYRLILMLYSDTGTEETHKVTESLGDMSHMQIHALLQLDQLSTDRSWRNQIQFHKLCVQSFV
jgi:hypothetical protein